VLYLLAEEHYRSVVEAVQNPDGSFRPGFAPLEEFAELIFRGEEIGKRAISGRSGRYRMLLGGQSVQPYRVVWEGYYADQLRKDEKRYRGMKILIQKSAPRLVAAIDSEDYAFPQSVYAVRLRPGALDPYFLLALLNSQVMSDYLFAVSTGYKLLQPQIEIEDLRALPMPVIRFCTPKEEREGIARRALQEPCRAAELAKASDIACDILSALARRLMELMTEESDGPEAVLLRQTVERVAAILFRQQPI